MSPTTPRCRAAVIRVFNHQIPSWVVGRNRESLSNWAAAYAAAHSFASSSAKPRRVFVPIFRQHAALIKRAFQDVSPEKQRQMEEVLKRIGRRAEELSEQEGHR